MADPPTTRRDAGFQLARIGGIPLVADASWVLQVALLTFIARARITDTVIGTDVGATTTWVVSAGLGLAIVACIVVHELAHSMVARAYGLPVKRIVLFMLGGVSQIEREAPNPRAEYTIAVAGPLASMVIASALAAVSLALDPRISHFVDVSAWGWFAIINGALAVFNLLPAFPMDGGRLVRSALWRWLRNRSRATRVAARMGQGFASVMGLFGLGSFLLGSAAGRNEVMPLWLALLGLFLFQAAGAAGRGEGGEHPNEPAETR